MNRGGTDTTVAAATSAKQAAKPLRAEEPPTLTQDPAPFTNSAEFRQLPAECRRAVLRRFRLLRPLLTCDGHGIGALIKRTAGARGMSPKTLRKYYDAFRHCRDWRVLIDRRKYPHPRPHGLPEPLIGFWRTLCEKDDRACSEAYRELLQRRERGELDTLQLPPIDPRTALPRGLTYRNLLRHAPELSRLNERERALLERLLAAKCTPAEILSELGKRGIQTSPAAVKRYARLHRARIAAIEPTSRSFHVAKGAAGFSIRARVGTNGELLIDVLPLNGSTPNKKAKNGGSRHG